MEGLRVQEIAENWVRELEEALKASSPERLDLLLSDQASLRDNGALTFDFRQFHGKDAVKSKLAELSSIIEPRDFQLSKVWPKPQVLEQESGPLFQAFFDFRTKYGTGVLVVNAVPDTNDVGMRATALYTRLENLDTIEENEKHPRGRGYTPSYPGQTWKQNREAARNYENGDPEVVIVGAGQAGLGAGAFLRKFGVDVLNVDRYERVGDSWGKRYDSLTLHNPVEMNAFPLLPFPTYYPEYLSKDLLSDWLALYAHYMDLNVWNSTEFKGATYNAEQGRWDMELRASDGSTRTLHPKHIVMATGGIGGKPRKPQLPGLDTFSGKVIHSSEYIGHAEYDIKKAVIVGAATSAHDISRDLIAGGIDVTMLQRGPIVVNNVETANLAYAGYMDPEQPTELVDILFGLNFINPIREAGSRAYHKMAAELDKDILSKLEAAGFVLGSGVDEKGWLDLFFRTGGGYYLNTGTSEFIADGSIKVEQYDRVDQFVPNGVRLTDGSVLEADLIVLATGYESRRGEVADAFGQNVADRVGEIARLDSEGEWSNMWGQTGQPGLWFTGGGINQMRPGSERMALLIKADLDGLISDDLRRTPDNAKAAASNGSPEGQSRLKERQGTEAG